MANSKFEQYVSLLTIASHLFSHTQVDMEVELNVGLIERPDTFCGQPT